VRAALAVCFALLSNLPAVAPTAEELVTYILHGEEIAIQPGQEVAQIPGGVTRKISSSPAIVERVLGGGNFTSRLTISSGDKCRFKDVIETKVKDDPPSTVTLEFDFSNAAGLVTTWLDTRNSARIWRVQITGLKRTGCSGRLYRPQLPPETRRHLENMGCNADNGIPGLPVAEIYSTERATRALVDLKTRFCKE